LLQVARQAFLVLIYESRDDVVIQQAEACTFDGFALDVFILAGELVFTVAEQCEIVVMEIIEERAVALDIFRGVFGFGAGKFVAGFFQPLQHRFPIAVGDINVLERGGEAGFQILQLLLGEGFTDVNVNMRLADVIFFGRVGRVDHFAAFVVADVNDRVQQKIDQEIFFVDFGGDGIDEERHVVIDEIDDRLAVGFAFQHRAADFEFAVAGFTCAGEIPVAHCHFGEEFGIVLLEVFTGNAGGEGLQ